MAGQAQRILELYQRLCEGKMIHKTEEAVRYQINERSVQRDIDLIRSVLAECNDGRTIIYDRAKEGFVLQGAKSSVMTNSEILSISKILLESRAFNREDMSELLEKLVYGCVPENNKKIVSDLLKNELFHYKELTEPVESHEKLWEISSKIPQHYLLQISYERQQKDDIIQRIVVPVSVLFSEYYFYLNAFIVKETGDGSYEKKYEYPALFRIDRIRTYDWIEYHFPLPYADRFQEGEFRKRVQFMYPGKLEQIRLKYTGKRVSAILDRLPTAQIIETDDTGVIIKAEVFGKGILMWLLSQGNHIELLAPEHMRRELKEMLIHMLEKYEDEEV